MGKKKDKSKIAKKMKNLNKKMMKLPFGLDKTAA
jgi:hypothetical protein